MHLQLEISNTLIFTLFLIFYCMELIEKPIIDKRLTLSLLVEAFAHQTTIIMKANNMNPDQTAPKRSCLIWVHIFCNIIIC